MIWLVIALVTSGVLAALVWPLLNRRTGAVSDGLGVFQGQLDELKRDRELGLVSEAEARAVEADIKRRLLAAAGRTEEEGAPDARFRQGTIAASAVASLLAVFFYMQIGRPDLTGELPQAPVPDMPPEVAEVMAEIDALAASLMAEPANPRGWSVLGQAYIATGRYTEAVIAFENAIDLVPEAAGLHALLGQAHMLAAQGRMTPAAREAVDRALDLDPTEPRARFFAAEALFQQGEVEAAIAAWQALLDDGPPDAGYRAMVERRLDVINSGENGG